MSFKQAYFHGGDMVEMDVQLSKDHIPVIYHDFQFCTISLPKDSKKKEQLIPIQLKSLSLKELRGLKIGHVHAGNKVLFFYVANAGCCILKCIKYIRPVNLHPDIFLGS